jgi:hypothetical protein
MSASNFIKRYQAGEHEAVWAELRAFEELPEELVPEAQAVADETMKRVAHNADLLAQRLAARGWKSLTGELRTKPDPENAELVQRAEEYLKGPIPISLKSFWNIVGGIDFVWDYHVGDCPDLLIPLRHEDMDPLCIYPAEFLEFAIDEWDEQPPEEEWYSLDLAPDALHKANISGGDPYSVIVPFGGLDPLLNSDSTAVTFVDYLRLAFKYGGFPPLEDHANHPNTQKFLAEMTAGFKPF